MLRMPRRVFTSLPPLRDPSYKCSEKDCRLCRIAILLAQLWLTDTRNRVSGGHVHITHAAETVSQYNFSFVFCGDFPYNRGIFAVRMLPEDRKDFFFKAGFDSDDLPFLRLRPQEGQGPASHRLLKLQA